MRYYMISGFLGVEDALLFEIELITSDSDALPVDGMLDTGFSYFIAIDSQDLEALGWTFLRQQTMTTARGDFDFDIYAGTVKIDGTEYHIPVHVGQDLPEVLLGRQWLQNMRLVVDITNNVLTLGN
jgi:clan AA aspartic protease